MSLEARIQQNLHQVSHWVIYDRYKHIMDSKKQKQSYLYQEIIEKNYDPEQFQEYLLKAKPYGDDLNNWSFPELQDVVSKFQNKSQGFEGSPERKPSKEQPDQKQIIKSPIMEQIVDEGDNTFEKESGQYLEFNYQSNHQVYSQIVNCIAVPPNSLLNSQIEVSIVKFQKKEAGLFSQSYVTYFVHTPFLKKTVERRYSDFQWLKMTLEMLHPGLPIPPIAKKGHVRRYDDKHILKRMLILGKFMRKLLQIPELKAERVFQDFLKLDDPAKFEALKSNNPKKDLLIPLRKINNMKGKVAVGFDAKINSFLVKTQAHFASFQPDLKKLKKQFKAAAISLEGCAGLLKEISLNCEDLNQRDRAFRKESELSYCQNNFFTILSDTMTRLEAEIQKQSCLLKRDMWAMVKYQNLYMLNILESFDTLASFQVEYQDTRANLFKKKARLFEEGNMAKWGIKEALPGKLSKFEAMKGMLPKQTFKLGRLREMYAMFNFQMYEELNRYLSSINLTFSRQLLPICRSQTGICSQMMMIWVDTQTSIMSLQENKYLQKC